jgi:hypothetical protein
MAITENWNLRSRAHACAHSNEPFTEGETFVTSLYEDASSEELVRADYSLTSWEVVAAERPVFSFWRSVYETPKTVAKAEVVEKSSAEGMLRKLVEDDLPGTESTRYILAVMLERKRLLKQTATRETEDATFLIYEQPKTGEVYIIRDPDLKLSEVEAVQREVSLLLGPEAGTAAPEAPVVEDGTQAA